MMRTPTLNRVIDDLIEARLSNLHTMLPGKVVKVDVKKGKCDVQPLIKRLGIDGTAKTLPVISNCPIGFYRSGKAAIYLPVKVDANVEIRFCERSLDIWLTKGGTVDPKDKRKHHLSDAVVYPGLHDFSQAPSDADPNNLVIVNDGSKIVMKPDGALAITGKDGGLIDMTSGGRFKLTNGSNELLDLLDTLIGLTKSVDDGVSSLVTQVNNLITVISGTPLGLTTVPGNPIAPNPAVPIALAPIITALATLSTQLSTYSTNLGTNQTNLESLKG